MLSLSKGRCIGVIEGGEHNGKYIRICEEDTDYPCCNWCNERCLKNKKKKCCENCTATVKGGCGSCKVSDNRAKTKSHKTNKKMEINLISGKVKPVTNPEKAPDGSYLPDTTYVAGPQGVGKSTVIGDMIGSDKQHYTNKDVIIFSNFEKDKPLDVFKPLRIKINDEMIKKPIQKEECRNSIVIFDDIDTIQPKKLAEACQALRSDFLQCGRKENIKVFATSHQLMNYKLTRDLLNSCNKIIFFPRGTSPYHTTRLLKEYVGLDKNSIKYILKLPSRWILIDKTYPAYALHENGCVLLNELPNILGIKESNSYDKYGYPQDLILKLKENKFDRKAGDKLSKNHKGFMKKNGKYISLDSDSDFESDLSD